LRSWGVIPIFWPPSSPDLSPIEDIWDRLKDTLREIYLEVHRDYQCLRRVILQAWESITDAEIIEKIRTMYQRCLDVIAANGMETK